MTGLREYQKEQRRQAIIGAAMKLFARQGYQLSTIEQIAKLARVSSPTVFNYFGSKQEILLEALQAADQNALDQIKVLIASMEDPVEILCTVEKVITEFVLSALPATLWRELLPLIICESGDNLPAGYKVINDALVNELRLVFVQLRDAGVLRRDADVEIAVTLLNDYSHLMLLRLCRSEPPNWEGHSKMIRRVMSLIYNGLREG